MSRVWIGLGSNLGEREHYLRNAAGALSRLGQVWFASVYETAPIYPPGVYSHGGPFLNTVCRLETSSSVLEIFTALRRIERENRRDRPSRFTPRTLDLDLLAFDQLCLSIGGARDMPVRTAHMVSPPFSLLLPHPRMHLRRFVLIPLAEINPLWEHPLLRRSAETLLAEAGEQGAVKWHCAASHLLL